MAEVEKKVTNFNEENDPSFLAVKGSFSSKEDSKKYVKTLAKAISTVFSKHSIVKLRCVGAAAVNNAVKASALFVTYASESGVSISVVPSFSSVSFEGSDERTAIVLTVEKR